MDERFSKIAKDPRFKKIPKRARKIKIDSRFRRMFTDRKFHTKYLVDKRGRKLKKTSTEDLHKFYDLFDENKRDIDNEEETELPEKLQEIQGNRECHLNIETVQNDAVADQNKRQCSYKEKDTATLNIDSIKPCKDDSEQFSKDSSENIGIEEKKLQEMQKNDSDSSDDDEFEFDDIRGEGGEDSSGEDDQEEATFENEVEHDWGNLDGDAARKDDAETNRLAICHLDWDRVTANDIFVLFNSFKPSEGTIRSVKIYPSEYGLKRMMDEDVSGPQELQTELSGVSGESKDLTEGSEYDAEKVRQYQLSRLKYYYAVVECDSKETADKIYSECDTMEYELSGTRLDLRFIPEDVTFDVEPKSVATDVPSLSNYKPTEFVTSALQQSNVRLTWDEPDPKRIKTTMRKFSKDDLLDMDFDAYLASSSDEGIPDSATEVTVKNKSSKCEEGSDSEDDEDKRIAKYRALLREIEDKEKKEDEEEDMEISWDIGLTKVAQKVVEDKKQKEEEKEMTPFEKYQKEKGRKRKDKTKGVINQKSENVADIKINDTTDHAVDDDDVEEERDSDSPLRDDLLSRHSSEEDLEQGKQRKQKRKKREENLTEEEKKEQQRSKDELELLLMDNQEEKQHFNYKSILEKESKKKKRKRKKDISEAQEQKDDFEINVKDTRFNALFTSHHFAIDPSDHQFKKSKAMETIIEEKQKRREVIPSNLSQDRQEMGSEKQKLDPSLTALVKTVKSKTEQFHQKKRKGKLK